MRRSVWWIRPLLAVPAIVTAAVVVAAFTGGPVSVVDGPADPEQVLRGRQLVLEHACSLCHGSFDPGQEGWVAGMMRPDQEFLIGPFRTRPRNLTPDNVTGIGRFSERQIFNALRYGLRPGETADVEITATTPGEGNFPINPKYLAPPMPWPAWRHMSDQDLWAIAAYLKHGVAPVSHKVEDSEGPPDFWASAYTPEEIGTLPAAAFPTAHETEPPAGVDRAQVLRGRQVAIQHDCGGCHGGATNPAADGWLAGITDSSGAFPAAACGPDAGGKPCLWMRPRNLTPDDATGTGRYTDRQIFNALRYGLRPSNATDVEIAADRSNFPMEPDYLGLGMPWVAWRHMPDQDLWALVAYLKHGLRPVTNEVEASDAPPDRWASEYTVEKIGPYPATPFPTTYEVKP
ncbi:MAG TPA: c-type cytochrome [Gemmatimonadales bacterium]|nr:c-type cytochrome [Gemmatimonadales bacterium]